MTKEEIIKLIHEYMKETDHHKACALYKRIINEYDRLGKVVPF